MILFIEGPRGSGKTFLINQFLNECKDSRIEYYKFYFANHVKSLGLVNNDADPSLHYFSLGNIMTILEMNQRPEYKDRIWVFDRALISAYAWAVLRSRLELDRANAEFLTILQSDLFQNCKTLYVRVGAQTADQTRVKDSWDGAHSTFEEAQKLGHFLCEGYDHISNEVDRTNGCRTVENRFDNESVEAFNAACYELLGIEPNK